MLRIARFATAAHAVRVPLAAGARVVTLYESVAKSLLGTVGACLNGDERQAEWRVNPASRSERR